jgi:hypothetical protein
LALKLLKSMLKNSRGIGARQSIADLQAGL